MCLTWPCFYTQIILSEYWSKDKKFFHGCCFVPKRPDRTMILGCFLHLMNNSHLIITVMLNNERKSGHWLRTFHSCYFIILVRHLFRTSALNYNLWIWVILKIQHISGFSNKTELEKASCTARECADIFFQN